MVFTRFDKTLMLLHENVFGKETIEEGGKYIKLVYLLVQMYNDCN